MISTPWKKDASPVFFTAILGLLAGLMVSGLVACEALHSAPSKEAEGKDGTRSEIPQDPGLIGPRRALTFVGAKAGEGYFSPRGDEMIFQSERHEGNPFYQIYRMNLKTGATEEISTGSGKTTCAWFHPSMKKALFASTHLDAKFKDKVQSEFESRKSNQKQKYAWSYDETYDIFEVDLKTKKLKQLTKELGYDAEGSYSPDGQWIAFASNRAGYTEKLSAEDQKIFSQDPSYMMDIYIMKADGSSVKRLTDVRGYDGGPFFSADGKKITWRRFTANGQIAEIMTMNVDGTEQKAVTRIGAMSWAPFFHSSGDYIVFTSNKLGYDNFELFIVDAEGKHEPVRASFVPGFDGLPVFSPDGRQISWTHRNEKGESQIYIAPWNDGKARELLGLKPIELARRDFAGNYSPSDAKKVVEYLAGDRFEGRMTGTAKELEYSGAIAAIFKDLGYKSYLKDSYFQAFEYSSGVKAGPNNRLTINSESAGKVTTTQAVLNDQFSPLSLSGSGEFAEGEIVFAGYGIVAPSSESQPAYDSYAGLDVKDKWVLAFREIPEGVSNQRRVFLNTYSRPHHKALVARERGARGLLLVSGPNSATTKKVMSLRFEGGGFAGTNLPVISISDELAEVLFKGSKKSLKAWQDELDAKETAPDLAAQLEKGLLPGQKISATVELEYQKSTGHNTLATFVVPGATGTVIFGAHGDHLGRGITGSSLARGTDLGKIHYGADDNASGVAALLQIAEALGSEIKKGTWKPKQNIIFAVWSGEEIGLLGSTHFVKTEKFKKAVYINMDMVGRLRESLVVQGTGSAKEWPTLIEKWAARTPVSLTPVSDPFVPSDAMAFYMAGIPGLHFFTGSHLEYHTPQDTPQTINYEGLSQVAQLMGGLGQDLASQKVLPVTYVKVESTKKNMEGRSFRIFLGTIPDYTQEGVKGVRITGTAKNSPAEKSGLNNGDIIVELGGLKIENLYDYVYALQSLKPNKTVSMKVKRGDKTQDMEITPGLKE